MVSLVTIKQGNLDHTRVIIIYNVYLYIVYTYSSLIDIVTNVLI